MPFEVVKIAHGDVTAEIVPERGAIVTALRVRGKDVLYLDRATLDDPAKNVRGGIPVLFPYAGKLVDELFVPAGTKMKQHGFGRNKAWRVTEKRADAVRVALAQDADTRAQYPYEFEAEYSALVVPNGVQVEILGTNRGAKPLPVSPGWHPYFNCPAENKNQVSGDVSGLASDKLGNDIEFDFGLVAPASGRAEFQVPGLGSLRISFSPEMRHLQFWSQPGKPFICLEPFYGPNNTVNTEKRCDIPPGQARCFWMRIELLG
jgi:galactose mutarotase-like enzyme